MERVYGIRTRRERQAGVSEDAETNRSEVSVRRDKKSRKEDF